MGVANLTDDELKNFLSDPKTFLADTGNQVKVLGLDNAAAVARVKAQAAALGLNAGIIAGAVTGVITQIPTIF
jgi:hypothetical protein